METKELNKKTGNRTIKKTKDMETVMQNIYLNIPKTDMLFFNELAKKMGWGVETKENSLQKYISSRPKNVDLSENEILSEINAVRYKQ
jgi:hypothetical protein